MIDLKHYKQDAARLIGAALVDDSAWQKLAYLSDSFGHRMNATPGQKLANEWSMDEMRREGLDNVRIEPVMVPGWKRGAESLVLLDPYPRPLAMVGNGNSVGTGPHGITAEAIVVSSYEELEQYRDQVRGRIVVLSPPWLQYDHDEAWENYLGLRHFRIKGNERAASLGAVAVLNRSTYPPHARQAHTGYMTYREGQPRIPCGALSPEDALMLERMFRRGQPVRLHLTIDAEDGEDVESGNVIGEIEGREKPEEVIVLACQFDTWDAGVGAQDDGAGAIAVWEPLRLMRSLGMRPRRTIRTLLCTNEENGGSGGTAYRDTHREELDNHVAMLEADSGVIPPMRFHVSGTEECIAIVSRIGKLTEMLGMGPVRTPVRVGTAEDIHATVEAGDLPSLTLQGNNEPYSRYHHAQSDMVEAVSAADLARATAGIAVMAWVLAEMPERLPRGKGEGCRGTYEVD